MCVCMCLCGIGIGQVDIELGRPDLPRPCDVGLDDVQVHSPTKVRSGGTYDAHKPSRFDHGNITVPSLLLSAANQIFRQHGATSSCL